MKGLLVSLSLSPDTSLATMRQMMLLTAACLALHAAHAIHISPNAPASVLTHRKRPNTHHANAALAVVIPGDSLAEAVAIDGALNFLSIYGGLLTFRILLSWVPQAQGISLLAPIFTVSDVYLNLFRGVIPAIGGLDISPIAAFFTLNLLSNSVASLGVVPPQPKPQ